MKKIFIIGFSFIIFSCNLKKHEGKWINKNNLCDSIRIENVNNDDYIFHFEEVSLPVKKENSIFKIFKNNNEIVGIISKDTILNINGIEYRKEKSDKIGNLNKVYSFQDCENDFPNISLGYDENYNSFSLNSGQLECNFKQKKVSNTEYELFFDFTQGSISLNDYCDYINTNFSKKNKVCTIKFVSNNVVKIFWQGFYDNNRKEKINLFREFENSTEFYFMSI